MYPPRCRLCATYIGGEYQTTAMRTIEAPFRLTPGAAVVRRWLVCPVCDAPPAEPATWAARAHA